MEKGSPDVAEASPLGAASSVVSGGSSIGTPGAQDVLGAYLRMSTTQLKKLSRGVKLNLLRELRVRPLHAPQLISLCASELLFEKGSDLGDDKWLIAEQGVIACLQCGDQSGAMRHYRVLQEKFGKKSLRLRKLAGLIHESNGNFENARKIYHNILIDCPADATVAKRIACMNKASGDYIGAIDALEKLEVYADNSTVEGQEVELFSYMHLYRGSDEAVYRELVYLNYMAIRMERALFYAEESILIDPMCYLKYIRHAELLYHAGQLERSATAYAQALRLNDRENSARALYGLWLVTFELLKRQMNRRGADKEGAATTVSHETNGVLLADARTLHTFGTNRLKQLYSSTAQSSKLALQLQRYH